MNDLEGLPSGLFGDQNFGGDSEQGVHSDSYSQDTVVLTIEFLSDSHARLLVFILRLGYLLATALLAVQISWKIIDNQWTSLYIREEFFLNVVVGAASIIGISGVGSFYLYRIYKTWRQGMRWSHRRKRYCVLGGISLLFLLCASVRQRHLSCPRPS